MKHMVARFSVLFLCLIACCFTIALAKNVSQAAESVANQRPLLTGRLNYLEAACASVGIQLNAPNLPTTISKVRLGTSASHAGVMQNDRVLNYKIEGPILSLRVERNDRQFSVQIPMNMKALRQLANNLANQSQPSASSKNVAPPISSTGEPPALAAQTGLVDTSQQQLQITPQSSNTLQASAGKSQHQLDATSTEDQKLLRQRQIILLVDKSGSMATKDSACDGLTRFEWCRQAIAGLANAPEIADKQFTLIFFNTDTDVIRGCDAKVVERMFSLISPDGGTDLSLAINQALNSHKPQLSETPAVIAILHDGIVNRGKEIDSLLIETGNLLVGSKQLSITFLQIGQDRKGSEMLSYLDSGLVAKGAKWDIVDTVPFSKLKEIGLKRALIEAIKDD